MNSKFRILLRLLVIFIILLIIIQPYNSFCNYTSKCQPFYISSIFPTKEGTKEVKVILGAKNYIKDLDIKPETPTLVTVSGRKNKVNYIVKNNSGHFLRFRMEIFTSPEEIKDHIKLYQCPCSGRQKLKKGEEIILTTEFSLKEEATQMMMENKPENNDEIVNETIPIYEQAYEPNIIGFKIIPY